jgi:hypothetical protein
MKTPTVNTVSLWYKKLPVEALPPCAGWIVSCMSSNAAFNKPPIPYVPPVPPDPTAPLDMTTRIANLETAIKNYEDGGSQALNARTIAYNAVIEGLDALGFYAQTVGRFNLPLLLASGFQARSKNRGQVKLDTPSITGIDNDSPTTLDVHATAVANALLYEVQTCIGTADWKTVLFSQQARTITLTGLTTGTVYNVRVRALGGSTGQSDWSMPGSSIVD